MSVSVADVMRYTRNHFVSSYIDGSWQLHEGRLLPDAALHPGAWIALTGDAPLPGVYQLDEYASLSHLPDGEWTGRVYLLAPPEDFLRLCHDIAAWVDAHPDPTVRTERMGQYSRSQDAAPWQQVFGDALLPYIRMFPEVTL